MGRLSRKDMRDVGREAGAGGLGSIPRSNDWRSRLARVASAFKSSGLQLSVWRLSGMRSLLSSWAATVQGTSGGGGEGGRDSEAPRLERLRRILIGSATLAVDACVGEK